MSRPKVFVPALPLAHRRPAAAAVCGVSPEIFDRHIRPHVPAVRMSGVIVFPVAGLEAWLAANGSVLVDELQGAA